MKVHATVVDNLLAADMLRDAPPVWVAGSTFLMAWAAALIILSARRTRGNILAFALCLPVPAGVGFIAYPFGFWWPMVVGIVAVSLALVGGVVLNYATEGRQKAFIKSAFRHYLGAEVIEQMLADPSRLKLGGEKREMTVFFSDIEKFSTFSERLDRCSLTSARIRGARPRGWDAAVLPTAGPAAGPARMARTRSGRTTSRRRGASWSIRAGSAGYPTT